MPFVVRQPGKECSGFAISKPLFDDRLAHLQRRHSRTLQTRRQKPKVSQAPVQRGCLFRRLGIFLLYAHSLLGSPRAIQLTGPACRLIRIHDLVLLALGTDNRRTTGHTPRTSDIDLPPFACGNGTRTFGACGQPPFLCSKATVQPPPLVGATWRCLWLRVGAA